MDLEIPPPLVGVYKELMRVTDEELPVWLAHTRSQCPRDRKAPDGHVHELAHALGTGRAMTRRLVEGEDPLVSALWPYIPFGSHLEVPGIGALEAKGGKERKGFDQPALVSRYAKEITRACYTDEGEARLSLAEVVEAAVAVMAEATGALAPSFNGWRSGVAKRYGIDLNEYAAERTPSPRTILIR